MALGIIQSQPPSISSKDEWKASLLAISAPYLRIKASL